MQCEHEKTIAIVNRDLYGGIVGHNIDKWITWGSGVTILLCALCDYVLASCGWWWQYRVDEQISLRSEYRPILWGKGI